MVNPTPTPDSVDMTHRSPVEIPKGLDPKSEPGSALTEANRRIAACVAEIAEARDNGFDEGRDSRLPGWMFWLALVVALGLGAFAGWQWYDGGKTLATTQNDLKTANNNLSAANINLEAVKAERDDLKVKVDARPKEIEDARTDGYSRGFDQAHNVYSCLNNEAGLEVSRINATTWALYCKEWSGDPAALFCTTAEGATTVDPEVDTCERGTFEERESQCSDEPTVASVLAGNGWVVDCGKDAAAYFCPWANEAGVDPDTDQCASY